MRIAVISDLHMSSGGAADSFGHSEGGFLRFLDFLERNFERVILLGDVFETHRSRLPGRAREELGRCRGAHPEVARRLTRGIYEYVHGNHDAVLRGLIRAPAERVIEVDGLRLLFTHGHQYDWLSRHAPRMAEAGAWLAGWLMRLGAGRLTRALEAAQFRRWGELERPIAGGFAAWALALARRRGADVVVAGHTHHLARLFDGGRLFLNTGACNHGQFAFASLDTRQGLFDLHSSW